MPPVVALPTRDEIPLKYTWDTYSIFPSDAAWEAACRRIEDQLPALADFRGRLGDSPQTLAGWFERVEGVFQTLGKVSLYASSFNTVDTTDQEASAKNDRAISLAARVRAAASFAEPEIIALGFDRLRQWVRGEPRLAVYAQYFDNLERRHAHIRSAEVEEVLAMAGDPFKMASVTYSGLNNADLDFPPVRTVEGDELEVAQGSINALLSHADRAVRRAAWEGYADSYLAFKNTLANCLNMTVKQDVFHARVRGYDTSLEAALAPDNIPTQVFANLIDTFIDNLPTWHRYWRLRRRSLGYDSLHVYDIKAPLTGTTPDVPYEQAVDWIAAGLAPLGDEYVDVLRRGTLEERWVDVYPNKGKRAGAYSSGVQGTHPFILMSYNDDLSGLSTLAHELGHSMHSYYTWKTQPFIYSRYPLFLAEVASTFNQAMVRAHLLATQPDPDFQVALLEEAMSNFHRYFFIMPTLARFELEIHRRVEHGEPLTADSLIGLMADLFMEGYGDEVVADRERIGITWAQFGHLYTSYYVYQYATGISGAHALAEGILSGSAEAAERYLDFLKSGSSRYPLDTLREAGVDLVSPEPVEKTFAVLASVVDRLEELVG